MRVWQVLDREKAPKAERQVTPTPSSWCHQFRAKSAPITVVTSRRLVWLASRFFSFAPLSYPQSISIAHGLLSYLSNSGLYSKCIVS